MIKLTRHTEYGYSFSEEYHPKWRQCRISDLPSDVILHYGFGDAEDEIIEYQIVFFNGSTVIRPLLLDDVRREWDKGIVKSLSIMLDILNGLMKLTDAVQLVVNDLGYNVKIAEVPSTIIEIRQTVNIEPYAIQCAELSLGDSKN